MRFNAVPKCPFIEAKPSKAVLKFIFHTKVNEIIWHNYSSKNMSNNIVHFSVTIIALEFQPIGFHHFYQKIVSNAHFYIVLSNIG